MVKMVTGDSAQTACAIAAQVGILNQDEQRSPDALLRVNVDTYLPPIADECVFEL